MLGAARLLARPESLPAGTLDLAQGLRVQQRLAELVLRSGGLSSRTEPVVIETAELNAFLAQHVEIQRLALRPLRVHAGAGQVELSGRTSLGRLLSGSRAAWLASWLPSTVLEVDLWLSAEGRLEVREGEGEFAVERAAVGRQGVPPDLLWHLLGIAPRDVLIWRMPRIVQRIEVQPGRLRIHTRPARAP